MARHPQVERPQLAAVSLVALRLLGLAPQVAEPPLELAEHVEGWMWKQDWLTALARNEHDADELSGICAFLKRASAVIGEGPGGK